MRIYNEESELIARTEIDGVRYDLYKSELGRGIVHIFDLDSNNVVDVTKFPYFAAAKKAYDDAIIILTN